MGKRKNEESAAGGFGRRRQTLQIESSRRDEPAPWETPEEPAANSAPDLTPAPRAAADGVGSSHVWHEVPDADSGDSYYWNVVTGETRWDRPDQSTILPPAALPRTGSSDSSSADTHTGADTNAAEEGGSAMPISSSEPDASASNAAAAAGALAAFDYGSDSDDDTAQEDSAQHATLATTASAPHAPPLSEEDRALAALEAIAHIDDMNQLDQADTSEKHQVGVSIEQQSERPSALSTQASEKGVASGGGVWSGKASSGADEARKAHLRMLADKFNGKTHSAAVSQPAVPQEMQSSAVLPQVPQEVPQHIAEVPAQVKDDVEDLTAEAGGQEAVANANTPLPTESLEMDGQEDAESVVGVMSESVVGAMSGHRPAIAFAMPKAKPCAKMHLASGKQALNSLRPAKDSDVDDFLAHLEDDDTQSAPVPKAIEARKPNGAPSPHAHTTTSDVATHVPTLEDEYTSLLSDVGVTASTSHAPATPSGAAHTGAHQAEVAQTAVCGEETRLGRVVPPPCTPLPRADTDEMEEGEVMGGDEKEEGEVSGDAEDVDVALDAHHGHATPDAASLPPSAAEGIVAAGRGVEVVNNELIGKVCFEVLTLKREGDDVIEALKSAIAEEEDTSEARRDVLLTLLGGMLSWSGLLSDLGILVSDEMTNGFSSAVETMLPKLRVRLSKCCEALATQDLSRQAGSREVLPKGWAKATTTSSLPAIYYRCSGDGQVVSVQKTAPANTRTKAYLPYGAPAEEEEEEAAPWYEEAHVKTMGALPTAGGDVSQVTMLIYLTDETKSNVGYMLEIFTPHQRDVTHIRIIGGGFVSVTFCSEFTCSKARDECIVLERGTLLAYPPLNTWTVLSKGNGEGGGVYGRLAATGDQVDRYPVHFNQAPLKEEALVPLAPLPATSGKDAADDPFADPSAMQHASSMRNEEGADTQSHLSRELDGGGERRKTPVFKTKTVAPKLKAKGDFNKQIQKWKQKQEELMPQDPNDGPSSLQLLEEEKKRKADAWFESQVASGGANPNLMPIGYSSSGQANAGFAIPAAKKKEAGWRDRLAAKF